MKRITSTIVCLLPIATAFAAGTNAFTGAYVGLGAGISSNNLNYSQQRSTDPAPLNSNFGKVGFAGRVIAGYNFALRQDFVAGLQVNANLDTAQPNSTTKITGGTLSSKMELSNTFGLSANLGYLMTPTNMLYARAGWQQTKMTNTATMALTAGGTIALPSQKNTVNGYVVALGSQQKAFSQHLSVAEEVSYASYNTVKTTVTNPSSSVVSTMRAAPRTLAFTINLIYGFSA